jgi:hypothetical protein
MCKNATLISQFLTYLSFTSASDLYIKSHEKMGVICYCLASLPPKTATDFET